MFYVGEGGKMVKRIGNVLKVNISVCVSFCAIFYTNHLQLAWSKELGVEICQYGRSGIRMVIALDMYPQRHRFESSNGPFCH